MADEHARAGADGPLVVDAIVVAPPVTEDQARAVASLGLLADDVSGLLAAWGRLEATWAATVERARTVGRVDERVGGEWSFVETLRHLVFVADAWLAAPLHPWGMPPHFAVDQVADQLDLDATPTLDEVLDVRAARQASVRSAMAAGDLDARSGVADFTRRGAFQVIVAEEAFHHGFATRDLAALAE